MDWRLHIAFGVLVIGIAAPSVVSQQEKGAWSAKSLVTFKRHTLKAQAAVLSPDGKLVALIASDNRSSEVKLWNAVTGDELAAPAWPKDGYAYTVAFSGNGQRLLVSGRSGRSGDAVLIWDVPKKEVVGSHHDPRGYGSSTLAANHEGNRYATAGYQTLGLWEAKTGNSAMIARPRQSLGGGAFTRDLKVYAFGNSQDIDLWDVTTGKELKILGEHRGVVKRVAFSRDEKTLIAVSIRSTGYFQGTAQVKLWDIATGKERWTFETAAYQIGAVQLSPDEKTLAMIAYPEIDHKTEVLLVDVASRKVVLRLQDSARNFHSPLFTASERLLVISTSDEKTIDLWEISR